MKFNDKLRDTETFDEHLPATCLSCCEQNTFFKMEGAAEPPSFHSHDAVCLVFLDKKGGSSIFSNMRR